MLMIPYWFHTTSMVCNPKFDKCVCMLGLRYYEDVPIYLPTCGDRAHHTPLGPFLPCLDKACSLPIRTRSHLDANCMVVGEYGRHNPDSLFVVVLLIVLTTRESS